MNGLAGEVLERQTTALNAEAEELAQAQ